MIPSRYIRMPCGFILGLMLARVSVVLPIIHRGATACSRRNPFTLALEQTVAVAALELQTVPPGPNAFYDLAVAYLAVGGNEAGLNALDALRAAAASSDEPDQKVQLHAKMASIHQQQGRLPEAIAAIGTAFDQARGPVPDWVLDVRRGIDTDPARGRLSADQIQRSLSTRSFGTRGFQAVPRLDLYILFDYDRDEHNAAGRTQVDALAEALQARAAAARERYRIIGHTDKQSDAAYNQELSECRAASVRRLVEARQPGLAGRLVTEGRGEFELKYPGDSDEDHLLNRRVEIEVIK